MSKTTYVVAPVPDGREYTVSAKIWEALTNEINLVAARIDNGDDLTPADVEKIRKLKKQVENYLTTFNQAMSNAQVEYRSLIAKQLEDIGYGKIEAYILFRREKQKNEQTQRLTRKQNQLHELVSQAIQQTTCLKTTPLANELLPAFVHRFPNINSAAKDKEISNWAPYESIIRTTTQLLDAFFMDSAYLEAKDLPLTSATMRQLLQYVRDGDLEHLKNIRTALSADQPVLEQRKLEQQITDVDTALAMIADLLQNSDSKANKVHQISRIIRIAEQRVAMEAADAKVWGS